MFSKLNIQCIITLSSVEQNVLHPNLVLHISVVSIVCTVFPSVFHMVDGLLCLNGLIQQGSLCQEKYSQLVFVRHLISGGTAIFQCRLHCKLFHTLLSHIVYFLIRQSISVMLRICCILCS